MDSLKKLKTPGPWVKSGPGPMLVCGPCSAESEEQLLSTAVALSKIPQVKVFRAGIWKPRTSPNAFQGVGTIGLEWMSRVRKETGLLTTVEVASPKHIEEALSHNIDILWIGARTVGNPFSVQEIADCLKGMDVPVMIKNPLHPDIQLWIGAIERIYQAGIHSIIAVHRGFHYFHRAPYRNAPMWEIPIELKRIYPKLTILCDPSHIAGKRDKVRDIAQKALDLEMDGLMIEAHIHPEKAMTDAAQQLSPQGVSELLARLVFRKKSGNLQFQTKLEDLRSEIDKMDWELLDILARRMKIVEEIGEYKKANNITILQIKRWRNIIQDRLEVGTRLGLSGEFLIRILEIVHQESIQRQVNIMDVQEKKSKAKD